MKFDLNCIVCNINQVIKITEMLEIDSVKKEKIMKEVLNYLSDADYSKCNPEIIGGTWNIITNHIKNDDPYKEIKKFYNIEILKLTELIEAIIEKSENSFKTALKIAILGNIIDFAAKHEFDDKVLKNKIMDVENIYLEVDDSDILYEKLKNAKTLMYLGDNCGEISLDKSFIKYIKNEFPKLEIYFGVRGKTVLNDVTIIDAQMVAMEEVAKVISNGDDSLGTVIERVDKDFKNKYYNADVVIAKGQGNYESLSETDRSDVFHLFMVKCDVVADLVGAKNLSIVCVENKGV